MSDQIVINQHYIPQCLLKYFANDRDQVFEALVEKGRVYPTNFRNSMSERFTYEHPRIEKNKVERYFHKIESYIGSAVQRIIDTIEKHEREENDFSEIEKIVFQHIREFIIFYYRSGALLKEFEFEQKNKSDRVFLMLDKILNSGYIRELSRTIISYYDFAIIKSDNNEFVLSDQYMSTVALAIKNRFFNTSNRHIGMKDLMILIPLSSKYYVIFFDGQIPDYISKSRINTLLQEQVELINEAIINNSYTKCIGSNRDSLEGATSKFEYQSPSATYAGGNGTVFGATLKKEVFFYQLDKEAWELFKSSSWVEYRELGRNDKCACISGKKFKICCKDKIDICKRMYSDIEQNRNNYKVHDDAIGEKCIDEFHAKEN